MATKIPHAVKVAAHTYTVECTPAARMGESMGVTDTNELRIRLRQRMRRSKAREILLHEVLHACTYPALISGEKMTDEQFIETVAPVLLQVIQDNPELIDFLRSHS